MKADVQRIDWGKPGRDSGEDKQDSNEGYDTLTGEQLVASKLVSAFCSCQASRGRGFVSPCGNAAATCAVSTHHKHGANPVGSGNSDGSLLHK